jgi:ATP-dependent protease ClpP protease subunit
MIKIVLSGEIGWDIYPEEIREQLNRANGEDLDVHIASPGGGVMSGIEIFNMFRDYKREHPKSQIMATIKGMAASMASYIAMNPAFDLVLAEDNAVFMIHNAWGHTSGDYREMKTFADVLEGLTNIIGKAYTKKTKKKIKEIREMMDNESWFFGDEIVEAGFVDEMVPTKDSKKNKSDAVALAKTTFLNLSEKRNDPENQIDIQKIAAMIKPENNSPSPEASTGEQNNNNAQTPAQRENNNMEVITMNLVQFLAENPAAKMEYDAILTDNFNAGAKAATESMQAKMNAAAVYLAPDSNYPATVKSIAIDVLKGTKTPESLQTTASAFDALKEAQKSDLAAGETEETGSTPGDQTPVVTQDGVIKNDADFSSEIVRTKSVVGMEV